MDNLERLERQYQLENEMVDMGVKKFWTRLEAMKQKGHLSETEVGQLVLKGHLEALSTAVKQFIKDCKGGKPGRRAKAFYRIRDLHPDKVAFITLKMIIDTVAEAKHQPDLQFIAKRIGRAIEDEGRLSLFQKEKPFLYNKIVADQAEREIVGLRKRNALVRMMERAAIKEDGAGLVWESWPHTEVLQVGTKLIELVLEANLNLIEIQTIQLRHHVEKLVYLTPQAVKLIEDRSISHELLTPTLLPCLVPPKPWTNPYSGGYLSQNMRRFSFVKTRNQHYLNELCHVEMPLVYQAVNAVQSTPWKINRWVLDVVKQVWESGLEVEWIVSAQEIPRPAKPVDIKTNQAARNAWKMAYGRAWKAERQRVSKRIQGTKLLWLADKFAEEEAIYIPHNLDFRGRMYAMPSYLHPQSCDLAKGLLEFAEGKKLGASGLRWLKIHLANTFGEDKCSLEARVKWADEHHEMIIGCAAEPLVRRDWIDADKPFQFLAACREYANAWCFPEYVSHLPISVDGSCNGLQNFSAMLRDEVGGKAVNLVPSEQPQDIYQVVADKLQEKFAESNSQYASQWLAFGFNRKETKRSVMILPYAGTQSSMREYVEDRVKERVAAGESTPWGDDHHKAVAFFVKEMWGVLNETVIAAMGAMKWLKKAASIAAKDQMPVTWTTPLGFPALQLYPEMKSRQIDTMLCGQIVKFRTVDPKVAEDGTVILDEARQASAVAPNFVHSMDAANLMLCVCRCLEKGITNFSMVHDSYGTLAADMDTLAATLRESFVELYQTDVLKEFEESVRAAISEEAGEKLEARPSMGSLDLGAVLESTYFFA